jgi:3',5'-cyclic AMP phosphodiesterase CpdA
MESKSRTILWVSDLHFSIDGHHQFPETSSASRHDLGQAIEESARSNGHADFAAVIISGDLTWKANEKEFEHARAFINRIASSPSGLDSYRFAVCPGNHDLAFTEAPDDKSARIHDNVVPGQARANYVSFYQHLFYLPPNEHLSCGRRFLLGLAIPVELVCLNSSLLDQKPGWYQGHGFIGQKQLDDAAVEYGWVAEPDKPRPFRIAVLHHHLMPVIYREVPKGGVPYSVVFDAEALVQWVVNYRVDLVYMDTCMSHSVRV